jgi:hypothetical protein
MSTKKAGASNSKATDNMISSVILGDIKFALNKSPGSFAEMMRLLVEYGCFPCCSYRGSGVYRFHVNAAGNFWDEGKILETATRKAVKAWIRAGCPIDGLAACNKTGVTGAGYAPRIFERSVQVSED